MAGSSTKSSRRARVLRIIEYPAATFAKLAEARLEKHWTQTYMVIGIVSSTFIVLSIYFVEPKLLPSTNLAIVILTSILAPFLILEYRLFTLRVHRKTAQLYDAAPCQLKLTILRVYMKRRLVSASVFGLNFIFLAFVFTSVSFASLTGGIPYYFALNAIYLLDFRISKDQELNTVFEAVPQLRSLPEFYQTMTMRVVKDKIKKRLRQQMPVAGEINPDPFLRMFYLDYVIPQQPSPQAVQLSTDLKNALANNGDLFGLLNQKYPQTVTVSDTVSFNLPWEKRFNWGRIPPPIIYVLEALVALYTLGVFAFLAHLIP